MNIGDKVKVIYGYKHFSHSHLDLMSGQTGIITNIGDGTDETMQFDSDYIQFDNWAWYNKSLFEVI